MQYIKGDRDSIKVVGDEWFLDCVTEFVEPHIPGHYMIIQSLVIVEKEGARLFADVFPLWLNYYEHRGLLNNPWKIVVVGGEWEYKDLPYYITPCQKINAWEQVEQLLKKDTIDYSNVPENFSGRGSIEVFFHGHGEGNIKGVVGKIADFVRNGIRMLKEGENDDEVKEIFFQPAAEHLAQLKKRLEKYRLIFEYLPWEKEINTLNRVSKEIESFIGCTVEVKNRFDEILDLVNDAFNGISELMMIHKFKERNAALSIDVK